MNKSSTIHIRNATVADFVSIRQIAYETWPLTFGSILSEAQISYMLEMMYSDSSLSKQVKELGHRFIIIDSIIDSINESEVSACGYASFQTNYGERGECKVHKIYVLPAFQGKGLGKMLLDELRTIAISENQVSLLLNVNRDNKAISFYEKYGFKIFSEEDIDIGDGFYMNDYKMKMNLGVLPHEAHLFSN